MTEGRAEVCGSLMGGLGVLLAGAGMLIMSLSGADQGERVLRDSLVTVDVGTLPSSDCWVEVGMRDVDGKRYGAKIISKETLCP